MLAIIENRNVEPNSAQQTESLSGGWHTHARTALSTHSPNGRR